MTLPSFGRRHVCATAALLLAPWIPAMASEPAPAREILFNVFLDSKPIGEHLFRITKRGEITETSIDANFSVSFLGFTAYRYKHHATETWRGDCLQSLSSDTHDDGTVLRVRAKAQADALVIDEPAAAAQSVSGCVMSFAYWNPEFLKQGKLLNGQNGRMVEVKIERIDSGALKVAGAPVQATRYRITGTPNPIELWYSPSGEWIGLDSLVGTNHRLSYRRP